MAMLLKSIARRETGECAAASFESAHSVRMLLKMQHDKSKDISLLPQGALQSLSIDRSENRYMLVGGAHGYLAIIDLAAFDTGSSSSVVPLHQVGTQHRHRHQFSVETVSWYPHDTGLFFSSGIDGLVKVWDTNNLISVAECKLGHPAYSHHVCPVVSGNSLLAVGLRHSSVLLYDVRSNAVVHHLQGHKNSVFCVQWSPVRDVLLSSGGEDGCIMMWDVRRARSQLAVLDRTNENRRPSTASRQRGFLSHSGSVNALAFTDHGSLLLSYGTDGHFRVWDVATGLCRPVSFDEATNDYGKKLEILAIDVGRFSFGLVPAVDEIWLLDLNSGEKVDSFKGHFNQILSLVYDPTRVRLFSTGLDRNLLAWSAVSDYAVANESHLSDNWDAV